MGQASTTLTIELPKSVGERLQELARTTHRTLENLAQEALSSYVENSDWQVEAIRQGIADADAGRMVDHDAVASWLRSWGGENELEPPECG